MARLSRIVPCSLALAALLALSAAQIRSEIDPRSVEVDSPEYQERKAREAYVPPSRPLAPQHVPPEHTVQPVRSKQGNDLLIPLDESFTLLHSPVVNIPRLLDDYVPPDYTIKMRSRQFVPAAEGPGPLADAAARPEPPGDATPGRFHCVIQFVETPNQARREALESLGVLLLDYVPNLAYMASVRAQVRVEDLTDVRAVVFLERQDKQSAAIREGRIGSWAVPEPGKVDLIVYFHKDVALDAVQTALERAGIELLHASEYFGRVTIRISMDGLDALSDQDWVQWMEPIPPPRTIQNDESRAIIRVEPLQQTPHNLQGQSLAPIGIWDGSAVQDHIGFAGRLARQENDLSDYTAGEIAHAMHVCGTMAGTGAGSDANGLRGMAPAAPTIAAWDYDDDVPTEMLDGTTNPGIILSQNSWGFVVDADNCALFGDYESWTRDFDQLVVDRDLNIVFAAGNSRDDGICGLTIENGYGCIPPPGTGKNTITVGAITKVADGMTDFSSWGPTDDGRLKPDVVAAGLQIESALPGDTYGLSNGTSMAAPAVSGAASLVIQRYRQLNNNAYPDPALLKGILLNTAVDLGNPGPDYRHGYGKVDALEAVRTVERRAFWSETIEQGNTQERQISVANHISRLRVMLTYSDPSAAENANPALVNDLDLVLVDPTGIQYRPFTLDPAQPGVAALRARNGRDNVEQVTISSPLRPGIWRVWVSAPTVPQGPQEYFVTWDWDPDFEPVPFTNGSAPLYRNDDGSTNPIPIPFDFQFFGSTFNSVFINNNGNVSFEGPYWAYTPEGFPVSGFGMVAPFWADVDTRNAEGGVVWYRTEPNRLTIVWDRVGYYGRRVDKLNTFELILTDGADPLIGLGNNVALSYGDMQWTTGDASGGSGGFGGSPATVGANKGDGLGYVLIGRFDHEGLDYDGPGGNADGVSYLDGKLYTFSLAEGVGSIFGKVFRDDNDDCVQDPGEPPLANWTIILDPGGAAATSGADGTYGFSFLAPGSYTVREVVKPNWELVCPDPPGIYNIDLPPGGIMTNVNFGNQPHVNVRDLTASVAGGPARPGFEKIYGVSYQNVGTVSVDGVVTLWLPPEVIYLGSDPLGVYDGGSHTVTWDVGSIASGAAGWLRAFTRIPPETPRGTILTSSVLIEPTVDDANPADNFDTESQIVTGSYDPNDKLVTPAQFIRVADPLTYQVRFQNTGNDTAFTVIIRDTLDTDMDISTVLSGAASHSYTFSMTNRELSWTFANILLPDSTTNEPESHGFVKFTVRANETAQVGTEVLNSAGIYFDYNPPVITNTVHTLVTGGLELEAVADSITFTPSDPIEGDVVTVRALVRNNGPGDGVGVRVRLVDQTEGQADPLAPDLLIDLAAEADSVVAIAWDTYGWGGARIVEVQIDPDGEIAEAVETDNQADAEILVIPAALCERAIALRYPRWEWITIPVQSQTGEADSVFANLGDNLVIVQDDAGGVYIPSQQIDTLSPVRVNDGYQILLASHADTLFQTGPLAHPATCVPVAAERWNLIPYLNGSCNPLCTDNIPAAMAAIAGDVAIVQDGDGRVWIPGLNIDTISPLNPNMGYRIYLNGNEDREICYPACVLAKAAPAAPAAKPAEPQFFRVRPTGLVETVVLTRVESGALAVGDEIGLYSDGDLVGAARYEGSLPLVIPVWRPAPEIALPGFAAGGPISARIRTDGSGGAIEAVATTPEGNPATYTFRPFVQIVLGATTPERILSFAILDVRPNPMRAGTSIRYQIPEPTDVRFQIYDVAGRLVAGWKTEHQRAGVYATEWDGAGVGGLPLRSGVYFLRATAGGVQLNQRLLVVR